jgi:hypothetical protein
MKKLEISLRLFGLTLAATSVYLWLQGGLIAPVEYHGVTVTLPLHIVLFLFGILLLVFPVLPLTIFVSVAPEKVTGWARVIVESYALPNVAPSPSGDPLADRLNKFIKYSHRRFWITLLSTLIFVTLVAPFLVTDQIAKSSFRLHSNGLLRLLRDTRFDFSSADLFRQELQDAAPAVNPFESTATYQIYQILSQLYGPTVTNTTAFERQLTTIYDTNIKPYVQADLGLLDLDSLPIPYEPSLEPTSAKVVLLTLLANICNEQGNQGRYADPYLQGRQLLKMALAIKIHEPRELAYTNNVLGVNYADSLHCYKQYIAKFAGKPEATPKIRVSLGENQPLAPLTIARLADYHYRLAADASSNNFAKSRYLNNSADLRISLLKEIHLQGIELSGQGTTDEQFLIQNVDPPVIEDPNWRPTRLVMILQNLSKDLGQAIDLSHGPRIYFTRAQLYSLGGQLHDKYRIEGGDPWGSASVLRELGLQDLRTAASLGLPTRILDASRAGELGVDWLLRNSTQTTVITNTAKALQPRLN